MHTDLAAVLLKMNFFKDISQIFREKAHISYPTRHGKSLIDHISTSILKKAICENVIPYETISDQDTPFAVSNIKKQKF